MKSQLDAALAQLEGVVVGKARTIRLALCCLLARGHLLIEDIPGVGKTTLARALARCLGLDWRRIQFTSDLLPADVMGSSIFDRDNQKFVFHPGPIFSQLLLADEINRATPKTQSSLLEAMEEEQVTSDGQTHALPRPFFVIATQNPHHLIGTYPLPESQLDRFLLRIELGFPDREAEKQMLAGPDRRDMILEMKPIFTSTEVVQAQKEVKAVYVSGPVRDYILNILQKTRENSKVTVGLSPRAGLSLQRAAQAWAYLEGRDMVVPEDIQAVARNVMGHRLQAAWDGSGPAGNLLADEIIRSIPVP